MTKATNKKLTAKQELFVKEYLVDLNATQAAIRAGYSEKTANEQGARLLVNVSIQKAISEQQSQRLERTKVDADYVLKRLVEIDEMDILDILTEDMTSFRPLRDWPRAWRRTISGFDMSDLFEGHGDEREMIGILKKIKWPDKVKNLELLGKHIDVQAFREQRLLDATVSLADTMNDIARRNADERVSPLPKDNINFPKDQ